MKKVVKIVAGSLWALPFMAFAATFQPEYITSMIDGAKKIMNNLVVALVALAVVWFIWNVIRYTMSSDDDKKKAAKDQMIYGIVAILVIVSIWGIVGILQGIFGLTSGTTASGGNTGGLVPTN